MEPRVTDEQISPMRYKYGWMDFSSLEPYFAPGVFREMSLYEKYRLLNMKSNYEQIVKIGLPCRIPEFMIIKPRPVRLKPVSLQFAQPPRNCKPLRAKKETSIDATMAAVIDQSANEVDGCSSPGSVDSVISSVVGSACSSTGQVLRRAVDAKFCGRELRKNRKAKYVESSSGSESDDEEWKPKRRASGDSSDDEDSNPEPVRSAFSKPKRKRRQKSMAPPVVPFVLPSNSVEIKREDILRSSVTCSNRKGNAFVAGKDLNNQEAAGFIEVENQDPNVGNVEDVGRRYPRRGSAKQANYAPEFHAELELSEDEFVYCQDCDELIQGLCTVHEHVYCPDKPICDEKSDIPPCRQSLPAMVSLSTSKIRGAGLGVWADQPIAVNTVFGPFKGNIRSSKSTADQSGYSWKIRKGAKSFWIDGKDEEKSNWLRYVNCARYESEQNLVAFQYRSNVFYKVYKPIVSGAELLVWYGSDYGDTLGITLVDAGIAPKSLQEFGSVFACPMCQIAFTSANKLDEHVQRRHSKSQAKSFACQQCDKVYSSRSYLDSHVASVHDKSEALRCKVCGKYSADTYGLSKHQLVHTGEKPFECGECGRRFNRAGNLRQHERTVHAEDGGRQFVCGQCGKGFGLRSSLSMHQRTVHEGVKPFKCEVCEERFGRKDYFNSHMKKHAKGVR